MYVAPESKVLLALANVAATSTGEDTVPPVEEEEVPDFAMIPPCVAG